MLVAAALVAGTGRMIAQSIAWAYAPGARPYSENDDLDLDAEGTRAISVRGVEALERLITDIATSRGRVFALRSIVRSQEPAVIKRAAPRHCTSMPRPTRRYSRSNEAKQVFSISRKTADLSQLLKRAPRAWLGSRFRIQTEKR